MRKRDVLFNNMRMDVAGRAVKMMDELCKMCRFV